MHEEKNKPLKDLFKKFIDNPEENADPLVCKLQSLKEQWTQDRDRVMSRIWRQNIAFYSGNHYVRQNGSSSTQYRVKLRENHLNNTLNRILSIVTQNIPIVRVFPESSNYQDVQDAENCEQYLKYYWRVRELEKKLLQFEKYALIFGNSFIYTRYNPDLGGKIVIGSESTDSGEKIVSEYKGDIEVKVLDPFKVIVRPGVEDWHDHYDAIIQSTVSKEFIKDKFGDLEVDDAMVLNPYSNEVRFDTDCVILNEYYHKPTPWFEEGLYACWAGKKLLKVRPAAVEAEKELPLQCLQYDKIPMRFYANSAQDQLMDIQEQLNRASSFIVEARNLMARPRVIAAHQSKIASQSLSDRPGDIVKYDAAGPPPQFIVPSFNFGELAAHKNDLRNTIGAVSGITGASRGEIPAATRTAMALQLVLENDRSSFAPHIKEFYGCINDLAKTILRNAAEYFDESDPRVIKIEGKTNQTRTFYGKMVPSELDIALEDSNPLGWTAGARIEAIQSLAQMGVLKDRNQILEMLKLNSQEPAYEIENINRITQQKENEELNQAKLVEVLENHAHDVHLNEIDKVMCSYEFKSKPPLIRAAYQAHRQAHMDFINQAMMSQMMPQGGAASGINPSADALSGAAESLQPELPGQNIEKLLAS